MKIFTKLFALAAAVLCFSAQAQAQGYEYSSINPESGLITDGQTIEITYDAYIDWYMRVNAYNTTIVFEPLNGTATAPVKVSDYQGVAVNAKTMKVTFKIPATGYEDVTEWALLVPANQIVNSRTNVGNSAIRMEYKSGEGDNPIEPAKMVPVAILPDPAQNVAAPFNRIQITFPEAADDIDVVLFDFDNFFGDLNYSFTDESGKELNPQFYTIGNVLVFDEFSITTPGTYTLTMRPGFLNNVKLGTNEEIIIKWTVDVTNGINLNVTNCTVTYYDTMGRKIERPTNGMTVIRVAGDKAVKVRF